MLRALLFRFFDKSAVRSALPPLLMRRADEVLFV